MFILLKNGTKIDADKVTFDDDGFVTIWWFGGKTLVHPRAIEKVELI